MSSSLSETIRRALHGLWKGSLDDRRDLIILRGALFVIFVTAVVLLALDPVVRPFASMDEMRRTPNSDWRELILSAWAARNLFRSAYAYLWVNALAFAPALLFFLIAFLHYYVDRLRADGTRPIFYSLPWWVLVAGPLLAFLADEFCSAVALWALYVWPGPGNPLAPWLHFAIHYSFLGMLLLYGWAALTCIWIFSSWFFESTADTRGGGIDSAVAVDRARLRAAIADMMWRSKYALSILVLYGALVLIMDQTRDALLRQILDVADSTSWLGPLQSKLGLAITLIALVLLSRASWLWPRLILRLRSAGAPPQPPPGADSFAKWWCRILGLAPYLLVATMIANTFHDVPAYDQSIPWFVSALGMIFVLATGFLFRVSTRVPVGVTKIGYYDCVDDMELARRDMRYFPMLVGWGAPVVFLLARGVGLMNSTPPLALAVITAALAMWAGVLGWVAYESRRYAIPFLVAFVAWVGVAGFFDWTDAHRVRELVGIGAPLDSSALSALFVAAVILLAVCVALGVYWKRPTTSGIGRIISLLIAVAAVLVVIHFHDHEPGAARQAAAPASPPFADVRVGFDESLTKWVGQLPEDAWKNPEQRSAANAYPVFFVSSEGGGIRSAYWTAMVLARLKYGIPDFDRRTFALSGASGGSIGLVVYRACSEANVNYDATVNCIKEFGKSDLWTQLLGGMFFEDALAAVVPTWRCTLPGCGVLGRSYWFEGAMEEKVPTLAKGLARAPRTDGHVPYLFINVTRAETGERAIQSDVSFGQFDIPDAADLIQTMGSDLRLSTAAHNSSRFPFVNPVGALYGPACSDDPRVTDATKYATNSKSGDTAKAPLKKDLCLRLQDAGYFDNSATLTTIDILRGLVTRLDTNGCSRNAASVSTQKACAAKVPWIKPIVIEIRNNYTFEALPDKPMPKVCANADESPMNPWRAEIAPPLKFYPSVITAAITTITTRTAHMRNFEGELERDTATFWVGLGLEPPQAQPTQCAPTVAAWIGDAPVHRFDLVSDGILYPSGWLLSQRARENVERQAVCSAPYATDPTEFCQRKPARNR